MVLWKFLFVLRATLLAWFSVLPTFHEDAAAQFAEQKAAQQQEVADAIEAAVAGVEKKWPGSRKELAAFLYTWGYYETHFSLRIGRGECNSWECDAEYLRNGRTISRRSFNEHGGTIHYRAASYWQLHERTCSTGDAWRASFNDVRVAAREAARVVVRMRWHCHRFERDGTDWVPMVFSALASRDCRGPRSHFKTLPERVATYRKLVAQ